MLVRGFVLLGLSLVFYVAAFLLSKSGSFTDVKTKDDCNSALTNDTKNYKEGAECHIWDGSQCRKGVFESKTCKSKGTILPLLVLIVAVVLLLAGLYYLAK